MARAWRFKAELKSAPTPHEPCDPDTIACMVKGRSTKANGAARWGVALLAMLAACKPAEQPVMVTAEAAVPAAATAAATPSPVAPDDGRELEALRAEVARLTAENARLRVTPSVLAGDVEAAVQSGNAPKAEAALKRLAERFPQSAELGPAQRRVAGLLARLRLAEEEKKRFAALGFKALKVNPTFVHEGTTLNLGGAGITRRWVFDSYGDGVGWKYVDAERGQRLVVARLNVNSKAKDPSLFGVGLYQADGANLTQVGQLRYRFARWADFGAYLGTHADFRNDFSHTQRVPFSAGAALPDDGAVRKPLYLVVTREGCHKRLYDRQIQPPVHYVPGRCETLKKTLTLDDFKDGSLAVLRRLD